MNPLQKKQICNMTYNTSLILSEKHRQFIVWSLLCLLPIVGMAVDLVAPSLPFIASGLAVSTKIAKSVISIYLFGYALGNFLIGILTDALGRQKLIRFVLLGFVVVSLLPIFFPHITILLIARFLQGVTLGGVGVLSRSIISDVLPPEKFIRIGTWLGTMWGLGPIIGPMVGGYLQFYFNWQAGFCFFALIGLIGFIAIWKIVPETHFNRHPLNIKTIQTNFMLVVQDRFFMAVVLLMGLLYSLVILFNTTGPFLIEHEFHYSSIFFGQLALYLGIVFLCATFICRSLLKKYGANQLFCIFINLVFIIAVLFVIISYFFPDSILLVSLSSAVMFFAKGFISPLCMTKGLALFRNIVGTASAIMYLIHILITSLITFLLSFFDIHNAIPMMWIYFVLTLTMLIIYWTMMRAAK